jgi:uncharacterized Zn finger protein
MRIANRYCRYCSVDKEDERELKIEELVVTCTNCGKQLLLIPESPDSPFYNLVELSLEQEVS